MAPSGVGRPPGGMALVVVVGVLGMIAVLATAFVTMSQLERRASIQRAAATRAYLLARSGVEDAAARLAAGQDPDAAWNRYAGEDWDGSGGTLSPFERGQEAFCPGAANVMDCPVRHALRPSYFTRDSLGKPRLLDVEGRRRGMSGLLPGGVAQAGVYALRVAGSGFFVNGGDPAFGPATGYNAVLRRMLGTLAEAIDREDGANDGRPVDGTDGWALVDRRPPQGWETLEQVGALALGGSEARLEALRPYLTLHAWADNRVIVPNATAAMAGRTYHSRGEILLDHVPGAGDSRAPDFERIAGRIVGRAPVDLAWARRSRPALIALFSGLKGLYLSATGSRPWLWRDDNRVYTDRIGTLGAAEITNTWSSGDDCHLAADALLASTSELGTWAQWEAFCDSLPTTTIRDLRDAKRDVLKAAFNPNTALNKFNPNPSTWKTVDKSDLLVYSTEFSLLPLQGRQVECIARVLGPGGRLLASRQLRAHLAGPRVVRISTQAEFVCGDLGDLDRPGDETGVRLPGSAPFLGLNEGAARTWGHALSGLQGRGLALQSYPEPCYDAGSGLAMTPAPYDGNLQLATIETPDDAAYSVASPVPDMKMLARFDDAFELDLADADKACQADTLQVRADELDHALWQGTKPSTLYPDGAYSEAKRAPAYRDLGNADGFHGVLTFWYKPQYDYRWLSTSRCQVLVSATRAWEPPGSANQQYFAIGNQGQYTEFLFEITHSSADANLEHGFIAAVPPSHAWSLVTAYWDFQAPAKDDTGLLILNGAVAWRDDYIGNTANTPGSASDLTRDDLQADGSTGPHLLVLGTRDPRDRYTPGGWLGEGADATFDEFALYDLGTARGSVPTLASARYQEGRYYKESAYPADGVLVPVGQDRDGDGLPDRRAAEYFSAPIRLPAGSALRKVCWTLKRPAALPSDYVRMELVAPDGAGYLFGNDPARSSSTGAAGWTQDRQDWDLTGVPPGAFRLHAVFRRPAPVGAATPLLDSPVLDDLTLLYVPGGGLGILSWE